MSKRFNDESYLIDWRDAGAYPEIHNDICTLILNNSNGRFLDLGCCTGLIGQRLLSSGLYAFGIEGSRRNIGTGKMYGIKLEMVQLSITTVQHIDLIFDHCQLRGINSIVARRVFVELFSHNLAMMRYFAMKAWVSGIEEIYIQGRQVTSQSSNPLNCVEKECTQLSDYYKVKLISGECAIMIKKTADEINSIHQRADK